MPRAPALCCLMMPCWLIALLVVSPRWAWAQVPPAPAADIGRVKELAAQANSRFRLGDFHEALKLYREAYAIKAVPNILFNIGQCHGQLKEYDKAILAYRNYLMAAPDAPNRAIVESIIAEIEELQKQRKPPAEVKAHDPEPKAAGAIITPPPPARVPWPDARPPFYKRWWFWSAVGAVVVGGVVAGAVVGSRKVCALGSPGCPEPR